MQDWQELLAIARRIGWGAAEILTQTQQSDLQIQIDDGDPVTVADRAADEYILSHLHAELGTQDFAYLTEETYKTQATDDRLHHPWVWVIDPLDGTRDYIKGTGEYAVHIALVHDHRPVVAVVVRPAVDRLYFAHQGGGTYLELRDGTIQPLRVQERQVPLDELVIVASRSHRNERFNQLMAQFPCQAQRAIGSLGGKIAAIVEHQADLYITLSGQSAPKDWDFAAPDLILTEAGGQMTRFDGTVLRYNQADVTQWGGILASTGHYHPQLCATATGILAAMTA